MARTFYATGLFAVPTGCKRVAGVGADVGFEKEIAKALDENGDQQAATVHSEAFAVEETFEAYQDSITLPADLGVESGSSDVTLLGIRIETGYFAARITLRGVYFATMVAPSRKYTHGISLAAYFGAVDFMAATAGDNANIIASTIDIGCEYAVARTAAGVYVAHQVHSGVITATATWNGIPTNNAGVGWNVTVARPSTSSTTFRQWDVTGDKAMLSTAVV